METNSGQAPRMGEGESVALQSGTQSIQIWSGSVLGHIGLRSISNRKTDLFIRSATVGNEAHRGAYLDLGKYSSAGFLPVIPLPSNSELPLAAVYPHIFNDACHRLLVKDFYIPECHFCS